MVSVETLVRIATYRGCGKVLTNIQTEMDKLSSAKEKRRFPSTGTLISKFSGV